jgi:hypothetical protein
MNDDIRVRRVLDQEILMVVLRRIKFSTRIDLGHDGSREYARLIEVIDVGPGDFRLVRVLREGCLSILGLMSGSFESSTLQLYARYLLTVES